MASNRKLEPLPIPNNFNGTFNFFGFNFNTINFLEGTAFGAVLGLLGYEFAWNILYTDQVGVLLAFAIGGFAVGLIVGLWGINGDPIHTFFKHMIDYYTHRRMTKYNPRVKYEITYALSLAEEEKNEVTVGVENKSIFEQYKEKLIKSQHRNQQAAINERQPEESSEFIFEDDIGVTEKTPEALKRQAEQQKKKRQKQKKKGGLLDGIRKKAEKGKRKAAKGR